MSNIIDSIQLSGTVYTIQGSGGGNATVELTQAEYDALVSAGTVSANTYYIITDAQSPDITQYWTSAQTQSAITQATSGKVDTSSVVSSVTSASTDNEIPTAKAVWEAASGGSITIDPTLDSGSTNAVANSAITTAINSKISKGNIVNDYYGTVYLNTLDRSVYNKSIMIGRSYIDNKELAIAIGTSQKGVTGGANIYGAGGIGIGNSVRVNGRYSVAIGSSSSAGTSDNQWGCVAIGYNAESYGNYATSFSRTKATNESEFSCGKYNISNTGSTDADNTLFSVGNGTADNARHNAFEIRQNGDIYLTSGGTDIKLQDHLGGGGGAVSSAITSGDTNAVAGGAVYDKFDEVEQVTAAALNNINDRLSEDEEVTAAALNNLSDNFGGLKLMKLTQNEYNALSPNYDSNTLYVIVN